MQKGSVDLKAIVWLRNSIVLIVLGSYHGSIDLQLTLCAAMQSPRRLHTASTAFSCCRYRSLFAGTFSLIYKYRYRPVNKQFTVPFSLHRTFYRLISLYKPSRDCTSILKRFYALFTTDVHTQWLPRPRDATSIDENWTLTERRVRHLERTVLGRYRLSCHTVHHVFISTFQSK